jgi:hypothetical protein
VLGCANLRDGRWPGEYGALVTIERPAYPAIGTVPLHFYKKPRMLRRLVEAQRDGGDLRPIGESDGRRRHAQ